MAVDETGKRKLRRLVEALVLIAVLLPFVYLARKGTANIRGYKTNLLTGEYRKEICNGFSLVRTNGKEVIICNDNGMSCAGNILQIAAKPPLITGLSVPLRVSQAVKADQASYFIYDTSTRKQEGVLAEMEWRADLKRLGWTGKVVLVRPPHGLGEIIWSTHHVDAEIK